MYYMYLHFFYWVPLSIYFEFRRSTNPAYCYCYCLKLCSCPLSLPMRLLWRQQSWLNAFQVTTSISFNPPVPRARTFFSSIFERVVARCLRCLITMQTPIADSHMKDVWIAVWKCGVCKLWKRRIHKSSLFLFVITAGCSPVFFILLWVVVWEAKTSWQNTDQVELCRLYGFQLLTAAATKPSIYLLYMYIYIYNICIYINFPP